MSLGTLFFNNTVRKGDAARLAGQKDPEGYVEAALDLEYIADGHKYHKLDIYKPDGAVGKLPVIVDIHGGGWVYGDKELNKKYCLHLASYGFVVVNISYRLCPEVTFAESYQDVIAALDWVADNGENYGLDLGNAFVTGDSAGGHYCGLVVAAQKDGKLASLLGGSTKLKIKAAGYTCAAFNPCKLADIPFASAAMFNGVFGKGYKRKGRALYDAANCFNCVPDGVPAYFITAYGDFLRTQNLEMYAELKKRGVDCGITDFDAPLSDGNKLAHVYNVIEPWWEASKQANHGMCDFFRKYID